MKNPKGLPTVRVLRYTSLRANLQVPQSRVGVRVLGSNVDIIILRLPQHPLTLHLRSTIQLPGPILARHASSMAPICRSVVILPSVRRRGSHDTRQAKRLLFPSQLRHDGTLHSIPQPLVAPSLHDRLLDRLPRLVLPLLLPQRASYDFQPHDR